MAVVNYTVAIKPPNKIYTTFTERRRQPESSETPPWRARGSLVEVRPPVDIAERDVRRKCRFARGKGRGKEGGTGVHVTAPTAFFSRVGNSFALEIVIADVFARCELDTSTVTSFIFILSIERKRRRDNFIVFHSLRGLF